MKIVINKYLNALALFLVSASSQAASGTPPPPTPPPPPGLPVDGGIVLLLFVSLTYGFYKLYQYNINKKTPV